MARLIEWMNKGRKKGMKEGRKEGIKVNEGKVKREVGEGMK